MPLPATAPPTLSAIGFDADDTLWHNERYFRAAQTRFEELMVDFLPAEDLGARLLLTEARNIRHYGFGAKSFALSMIETAIEVSGGAVPAPVIAEILAAGREILSHPVELLPHVGDTLDALAGRYRLILVTKGDLIDQERKLDASGLRDMFDAIEIVSHKHPETYRSVFERHAEGAGRAMMVGNSLVSDVLPMLAAGGYGTHVPHETTWALERAEPPVANPRYAGIGDLAALPALLSGLRG